ncbi:hypothetical protein M427DRAFT_52285 [Gonapodya prolifera JEL478]|uniref:Hemerythrin-like domain-containing protein n=1 Tax=Gonapodya prolifera (strain JEL478) TaxID=1344416 RepID=A0A139ATE4_GONPJ|nr:hypothetical protein M427DRAFT_52285 [Gonapodya prolifera JEL478]|eukprot:KXS20001.1 hypothetical protein M427DRAFT_52285 [Gonapodya prolifera JEL478]
MAKEMTIEQQIVADHMSFRDLYDRYHRSQYNREKRQLLNEFIREVSQHSLAEETVLYPKLLELKPQSKDHVDHERHEHQKIKSFLVEVDYNLSSNQDIIASDKETLSVVEKHFEDASQELEHHMKGEERDDLPLLSAQLDIEARLKLGRQFSIAKMIAPTRPHPAAPNEGGMMETIGGMVAAAFDKTKDVGRSFPK